MKKTTALTAVLCAGSLALVACGDSTETGKAANETTSAATEAASSEHSAASESDVELVDGYCRAKPAADDDAAMEQATDLDKKHSDMTACFGTLRNNGEEDITVTSFATPELAGASTELHEVVDGVMQKKPEGFTIPAGGTYELIPGGDHLMIMNFPAALEAGDIVPVEITLDGGGAFTLDIPVREQPSGEENYGGEQDDHAGHESH